MKRINARLAMLAAWRLWFLVRSAPEPNGRHRAGSQVGFG
jgi:hypothetical protein